MPLGNILVADDDPKLLKMVQRTLIYEGFQVITAAGAGSAAAIAINNDLVQADTDRAVRTDHGLGTTA